MRLMIRTWAFLLICAVSLTPGAVQASEEKPVSMEAIMEELTALRSLVEGQQRQIAELQNSLQRSNTQPEAVTETAAAETPVVEPGRLQPQPSTVQTTDLEKKVDTLANNLGGFRFSGDFRLRADVQARSGNAIAGPIQNIRGRYRLRLNVDKDIDPTFRFHAQLSTGPYNNQITNDQDFAAIAVKHAFSVAEAYVDYHPTQRLSFRGGRMEEVFADNTRLLWDDDVRFNGFHQIATIPLQSKSFKTIEFRSAEYILSNPNVPILQPPPGGGSSPFNMAGYENGKRVGTANLFHPGVVITGDLGERWTHQAVADIQLYRNQNQIVLSTTAGGFPVVINNSIGLSLSGPVPTVGNATTTPGGAMYTAGHYQVARVAYRLSNRGIKLGGREMPFYFDLQAVRNVGTDQLRDAMMASFNFGTVHQFGDVRLLYQYSIKDANSLIAQFTDDDLGTGATTNIAVHAVRFDLGLTRALQWQNLLFIQNARRPNDPSQQFFVPVQRGASTTYRYLGQLAFTF
jgi:hypothetical protein